MTTNMFLERSFDEPLSVADVVRLVKETAWCYAMHKVDWQGSFLAADGRMMVCTFAAADAESVRLALRQSGADVRRLWSGTVYHGPGSAVPNVLVERSFDESVTLEETQSIENAAAWCLAAHRVKLARTFLSLDRKRMVCLYEAPDAEAVRLAQREAELPVDAVWAFERVGPDTVASVAG